MAYWKFWTFINKFLYNKKRQSKTDLISKDVSDIKIKKKQKLNYSGLVCLMKICTVKFFNKASQSLDSKQYKDKSGVAMLLDEWQF